MSAHTPGPWVVEPILEQFNVYIAAEACVCIARDCSEADARLIAAAPELLDRLVEATGLLKGCSDALSQSGAPKTAALIDAKVIEFMALLTKVAPA